MNENMPVEAAKPSQTLTEDVYMRLRADILSAVLIPGTKLKVTEISRRYDTGASPVREALSRLSSEDLVEKTENRGFRVAPISERQFAEIADLRCLLEAEALRRALDQADREWEDRLTVAFFRLDREAQSSSEWEHLHRSFHLTLLDCAGSTLLMRHIEDLYDQAVRYRNLSRHTTGVDRDVTAEHRTIFEASLDRNSEVAVNALLKHYKTTLESLAGASMNFTLGE
ncbi:MAG: GntR family transcriptional regulator [Pseudomonadota bacterium]